MGGLVSKATKLAAGLGLILGAAGTLVVALCFAIYAALRDMLTPAGASAVVVLIAAAAMGVGAMVLLGSNKKHPDHKGHEKHPAHPGVHPNSFVDRAIDLARDKPLIAAGAAVAAGLLALRNPTLIGAVVGAVTARTNQPSRR